MTAAIGKRILIIGHGVLGGDVLDFLAQSGRHYQLVLGARDIKQAALRANLARYTAINLGFEPDIELEQVDLMDVERTAETLARIRPDLVFNATTLHSWWVITQLPAAAFQRLDRARGGVWTPMHMVLARRLMQAVRQSGLSTTVVNASYPDVVNAALAAEGLSPAVGIGNVANAVPGIRLAAAFMLDVPVADVEVRFFAQHYLSYRMPSTGSAGGAPYHLTILRNGRAVSKDVIDDETLFELVATRFRRVKGLAGQSVTASSATAMIRAIADEHETVVHAPGPLGLVGGYPVQVRAGRLTVALPDGLDLETAIAVNRQCQRYDGIEAVDDDGTVRFTAEAASVMREELGYDCEAMAVDECEDRATELAVKFRIFADRAGASIGGAA